MQSCLPGDRRAVHPVLRQIHSDGAVLTQIEPLLLDEEADYIAKLAEKEGFALSEIGNGTGQATKYRTSRTAVLHERNAVVDCIRDRLATIAGMSAKKFEPLQVVDYAYDQEYKAHLDASAPERETDRLKTFFVYLKGDGLEDGRCGGATAFYRLRNKDGRPVRVYPKKGRALLWSNFTSDGRLNRRTVHAGEKMICKGVKKLGMNAWLLGRPAKCRRKCHRKKPPKKLFFP